MLLCSDVQYLDKVPMKSEFHLIPASFPWNHSSFVFCAGSYYYYILYYYAILLYAMIFSNISFYMISENMYMLYSFMNHELSFIICFMYHCANGPVSILASIMCPAPFLSYVYCHNAALQQRCDMPTLWQRSCSLVIQLSPDPWSGGLWCRN